MELSYNDQCDIVYGRIARFLNQNEDHGESESVYDLISLGLDIKGLGLSGAQAEMAFAKFKGEFERAKELLDSVELSWGVIADASDWDKEGREEWRGAARRWRDQFMPLLKGGDCSVEVHIAAKESSQ